MYQWVLQVLLFLRWSKWISPIHSNVGRVGPNSILTHTQGRLEVSAASETEKKKEKKNGLARTKQVLCANPVASFGQVIKGV